MTPEQLILKTIRDINSEGRTPNLEAIGTEPLSSAAEKFLKILGGLTGEEAETKPPVEIEGPPPPAATIQIPQRRIPSWMANQTQYMPVIRDTYEFPNVRD